MCVVVGGKELLEDSPWLLAVNYSGFDRTPIPEDLLFAALGRDKKNTDRALSLILLRDPGEVFIQRVVDDGAFRGLCLDCFRKCFCESRVEYRASRSL